MQNVDVSLERRPVVAPAVSLARGAPQELRFLVRSRDRLVLVRADSIDWIEAAGNYVRLRLGTERYLVRESISALERRLDAATFVRVHRSTIVNLDRVKELRIERRGSYVLVLRDGTQLRLARRYRAIFEARVLGGASVLPGA